MKLTFGNTELTLSEAELFSVTAFAEADKQYKDVEHLLEVHIGRLVDHCLAQFPNPQLKAQIKEAEELAQARLKLAMDAVRSPRPKTAEKLAEDIARVSPSKD